MLVKYHYCDVLTIDPTGGAYSATPNSQLYLSRPSSKVKKMESNGKREGRKGKCGEGKRKGKVEFPHARKLDGLPHIVP